MFGTHWGSPTFKSHSHKLQKKSIKLAEPLQIAHSYICLPTRKQCDLYFFAHGHWILSSTVRVAVMNRSFVAIHATPAATKARWPTSHPAFGRTTPQPVASQIRALLLELKEFLLQGIAGRLLILLGDGLKSWLSLLRGHIYAQKAAAALVTAWWQPWWQWGEEITWWHGKSPSESSQLPPRVYTSIHNMLYSPLLPIHPSHPLRSPRRNCLYTKSSTEFLFEALSFPNEPL